MTDQPKMHRIPPHLREHAAAQRKDPTQPERRPWQLLRKSQLSRLKFRRQCTIGSYIVDFCCPATKLIVEVDGDSHIGCGDADDRRDHELRRRGYTILRVTNDDVLHDLEAVGQAILTAAENDHKQLKAQPTP